VFLFYITKSSFLLKFDVLRAVDYFGAHMTIVNVPGTVACLSHSTISPPPSSSVRLTPLDISPLMHCQLFPSVSKDLAHICAKRGFESGVQKFETN
jgi:hypothetical protein